MTERPEDDEFAPFYAGYVARVPAGDIVAILEAQVGDTAALLDGVSAGREGFRYAPGKWSIREVVGHMADTERVLAGRALRFGRGDATPLPGFDENTYVPAGEFEARALRDIVEELRAVRRATVALFRGLPASAWKRAGTANDARVTVRGLAFIIAGHELHHREALRVRYGLGEGA